MHYGWDYFSPLITIKKPSSSLRLFGIWHRHRKLVLNRPHERTLEVIGGICNVSVLSNTLVRCQEASAPLSQGLQSSAAMKQTLLKPLYDGVTLHCLEV